MGAARGVLGSRAEPSEVGCRPQLDVDGADGVQLEVRRPVVAQSPAGKARQLARACRLIRRS